MIPMLCGALSFLRMHEQTKVHRLVKALKGEKNPESSIFGKGGPDLDASTLVNVRVDFSFAYLLDKGFVAKSYMNLSLDLVSTQAILEHR